MKLSKTILIIAVLLILSQMLPAEERIPPRVTMEDLSDPSSPSFVPHPYPKTRAEVISNQESYLY